MRITTQMLHNSAAKAGVTINHSLLNYINNDSDDNSLLNTLLGTGNSTTSSIMKNTYDELSKEADELEEYLNKLSENSEEDIFDKARESGSTEEICTLVEDMVASYNGTLNKVGELSDTMNQFYTAMMKEVSQEHAEALESIGITVLSDGTLSINEETLQSADIDALESVLGSTGTFSERAALIAGKIADNALANSESLTSSYDSTGNLSSYAACKYDFIG